MPTLDRELDKFCFQISVVLELKFHYFPVLSTIVPLVQPNAFTAKMPVWRVQQVSAGLSRFTHFITMPYCNDRQLKESTFNDFLGFLTMMRHMQWYIIWQLIIGFLLDHISGKCIWNYTIS